MCCPKLHGIVVRIVATLLYHACTRCACAIAVLKVLHWHLFSLPFHAVVLAHQWKHPWPRNVRRKEVPPTIAHKMTVDPSQQRNLLQSLVQVLAQLRVSESCCFNSHTASLHTLGHSAWTFCGPSIYSPNADGLYAPVHTVSVVGACTTAWWDS